MARQQSTCNRQKILPDRHSRLDRLDGAAHNASMTSIDPRALSWTALLGKWIDFAKASVALPDDAEGRNWRESVVPIINLQAVTFALAEIGDLLPEDRPVALDRAEVMIDENRGQLETTWGDGLPGSLSEIMSDAGHALVVAQAIDDSNHD